MTLLYYDPADGRALYTIEARPENAVPGAFIVVSDDQMPKDILHYSVIDGALVLNDLGRMRDNAVLAVNAQIGAIRAQHITELPGQEMIYLRKETQARAFKDAYDADPTTDPTAYPLVAAEIGTTGATAIEVADTVIAVADQWEALAATLENLRMTALQAIENAPDETAIDTAIDTLATALGALQ